PAVSRSGPSQESSPSNAAWLKVASADPDSNSSATSGLCLTTDFLPASSASTMSGVANCISAAALISSLLFGTPLLDAVGEQLQPSPSIRSPRRQKAQKTCSPI